MKTSYILLVLTAFVLLTGMVITDVLLKQQYEKIDWRDPYQYFVKKPLPKANHWVIEGVPTSEILVEQSADGPYASVAAELTKFYRFRQVRDTVFVSFTPDFSKERGSPRSDADNRLSVEMVIGLPVSQNQSVRVINSRLTLNKLTVPQLRLELGNSRLRTDWLSVSTNFKLTASQNSFAVLGPADRYKALQVEVADSSGLLLNNTQTDGFSSQLSPRAEIQLRGQALKWLK